MGLFETKGSSSTSKTVKDLMDEACADCKNRNGRCTDPNCGIALLHMIMPNCGSDWVLGSKNTVSLDTFWAGYMAGHMADTLKK